MMNIKILYEDNHLLIVEKPVNVPVQEDETKNPDLLTMLKNDLKIRYNKPGNVYLGLVHRLDRPVGGVIVFAKTSKAASRLSDMLRRRAIQRKYYAVVHGVPENKKGRLIHYLYKDKRQNLVFAVAKNHPEAKEAILDYEVLEAKNGLSLLSVQLHTGRPHQIRVQLASIGHPIVGDQKYGRRKGEQGQQIALWAYYLKLEHPVRKEPVEAFSFPPKEYPWHLWKAAPS